MPGTRKVVVVISVSLWSLSKYCRTLIQKGINSLLRIRGSRCISHHINCKVVCLILGHIDLVVLGAARYDPTHSWQIDLEQVEKSFDVNVVSLYRGLSVVVPYMLERGHGGISMIASISGYTGLPRALIYGATKAALQNLAETLYFELAPKGLSIYLINPGFVQTPMTSDNDFKMPGLMMPEAAAQAIMAGFERGDFEIRFPKTFSFVLRLVSMLPDRVRFALLHKTTGM